MCVESNLHPCNETDLVMVYNLNVALNLVYKDFIENSLSMFLRGISIQLFVISISGFGARAILALQNWGSRWL